MGSSTAVVSRTVAASADRTWSVLVDLDRLGSVLSRLDTVERLAHRVPGIAALFDIDVKPRKRTRRPRS